MATEPATDQSATRLVSGILEDAQELVRQQFALMKHEIRKDLREAKEASIALVMSGVLIGMGVLLLGFMLVHLLHWLLTAVPEPSPPLWVCFIIVGSLFGLGGLALFYVGKRKVEALTPLPEQSLTAMKENLQWTTKQN